MAMSEDHPGLAGFRLHNYGFDGNHAERTVDLRQCHVNYLDGDAVRKYYISGLRVRWPKR